MENVPVGELNIRDVKPARIKWIINLIKTKSGLSQGEYVAFIQKEFVNVHMVQAYTLYAEALKEMGDTTFSKEHFDLVATNDLLTALKNPFLPANERRRMWETLAKIHGYFKQTLAKDAVAQPANLQDPAVLEIMLKADEAIEKALQEKACSTSSTESPPQS